MIAYESNFLVPGGTFILELLVLTVVFVLVVAAVVGGTLWFALGRRSRVETREPIRDRTA